MTQQKKREQFDFDLFVMIVWLDAIHFTPIAIPIFYVAFHLLPTSSSFLLSFFLFVAYFFTFSLAFLLPFQLSRSFIRIEMVENRKLEQLKMRQQWRLHKSWLLRLLVCQYHDCSSFQFNWIAYHYSKIDRDASIATYKYTHTKCDHIV